MNSPFLNFPSLELEKKEDPQIQPVEEAPESPFLNKYQLNGHKPADDPQTEQFVQIMDELYDEEFEDALEGLINEASDFKEAQVVSDDYLQNERHAGSLLQQFYTPLNHEVEQLFSQLIHEGEQVDGNDKSLEELESFLDNYRYSNQNLTDIQENFLGKLIKKVKKVAKKVGRTVKKGVTAAGKLASKFGLGFLFRKLKNIAFKFLKGFLQKGIKKLPPQYRGLAQNLAKKIMPHAVQKEVMEQLEPELAADIQQEYDAAVAHLLTANNQMEWELVEREMNSLEAPDFDETKEMQQARQAFMNHIGESETIDDATPHVEQYVQAVVTGLKFVLPIVGRQRVINWLASIIAKLIERFIGKQQSKAISRQMVEAGFKMLNLETAPDDTQTGSSAVAATVEATVKQLENFPEYVFEDRRLFERYVVEAFEQAAAANMPDMLNESVYAKFPWLRESNRKRLLWKLKNRHNHRLGQAKIKRLNEVIETEITPFIAEEVRTFGGIPLATFLRDRMGVTVNDTVPVRLHLFEALPGAHLADLGKYAEMMAQNGSSDNETATQFHPLTSIASGLLMGEPGLGCRCNKCLSKSNNAAGHRYYYIEVPGARPAYFAPPTGKPVLRGITSLSLKLDFLANEIRLNLYLSEADAQAIAVNLRKNQPESAHLLALMTLEEGLKNVFSYGKYGKLKIVHPNVLPGKRSGFAIDLVPPVVINRLNNALKSWVGQSLISYLRNSPDDWVQQAENYADGVTLQVVLISPPDLMVLRQMITGSHYNLNETLFAKPPAEVLVSSKAGNHA